FWQTKSTVGWRGVDKIEIDLDLGKEYSLDSISINTARNINAEVNYPAHTFVFLSKDNEEYIYVGDIMSSVKNTPGEYNVEEFGLSSLDAAAQYVKLVVIPNGKFVFLDEIELFDDKSNFNLKKILTSHGKLKLDQIPEKIQ